MNNYLVSFKISSLRYNKLMPAFFLILEILLKRQQLLFLFFFYLLNRSKTGWLGFDFNVIAIHIHATLFLLKILQFLHNRHYITFMPKNPSIKIPYQERNDTPTSSATSLIVIWQLSKTIFFTSPMFSLVVDVLGRPKRASSLTSS